MKTSSKSDIAQSVFFILISICLNAYAFFTALNINGIISQFVLASFGASLVFLQVDSLRKWKTFKKRSYFSTYLLCTVFSLLSTCYLVTSLTLSKTTEREVSMSSVIETKDELQAEKDQLLTSITRIEGIIEDLRSSKEELNKDKSFYGDNFYTLKNNLSEKINKIDTDIQTNNELILEKESEIKSINKELKALRGTSTELESESATDIFTQIGKSLELPPVAIAGFVFLLLGAVLELGIFILTPDLISTKEDATLNKTVKDLLEKLDDKEAQLQALEKTMTVQKSPNINAYIDALFSRGGKKLTTRDDAARLTGFDQNSCDAFYIKLTTKIGSKNVPFVQTARGRGTYSEYTQEEIKAELKKRK